MKDNNLSHDCIVGGNFLNLPNVMLLKLGNEVVIRQLNELQMPDDFENKNVCVTSEKDFQPVFGDIDEDVRRQCSALLYEFRDCISFSMLDLN